MSQFEFDRPLQMPPVEYISNDQIAKATTAWLQAKEQAAVAHAEVDTIAAQRVEAVVADRDLYADAIEKATRNKPATDPGTPNTDQHEQRLRDAQRRAEAATVVAKRTEVALREVLREHRDEWADDVEPEVEDLRQELGELVDAVERKLAELGQAKAIASFARNPSKRWRGISGMRRSVTIRRSASHEVALDQVFAAMRATYVSPPQREDADDAEPQEIPTDMLVA